MSMFLHAHLLGINIINIIIVIVIVIVIIIIIIIITLITISRISKVEVKCELLKSLLGWDKSISGRNASLQLLNIIDDFNSAPIPRREKLKEGLYNVIPKIFNSLSLSFDKESPIEISIWMKILQGKSIFWLGGHFIESSRLAFQQLSSLNTEPFLFVVRGEMLQHEKLLRSLGVKDTFNAYDLAETIPSSSKLC